MEHLLSSKPHITPNPFSTSNTTRITVPSHLARYGIALLAVAIAIMLSLLFRSIFAQMPFFLFMVAVIIGVWYGGRGPSLLSISLSSLAVSYFFQRPYYDWSINSLNMAQLVVFVLGTGAITLLSERRREAERINRYQAEWFHTILANLGDGVIVTDREGRIIYLNQKAASLTGWSTGEALGQPIQFTLHLANEDAGQLVEGAMMSAPREGQIIKLANHIVLMTKDGSERVIDGSSASIHDLQGGVAGAVLAFHDVTARSQTEKALAAANERLRSTLESITDAYFVLDSEWRFVNVNPVTEQFFGRRANDLIGNIMWEMFPQTIGNEFYRQYHAAVAQGQAVHFEAHSDIVDQWFEVHAYPRYGQLEVYLRDVTARKRAEEAVRQSEERFRIAQDLSLDAFTILESVRDSDGEIEDFRWVYVNPVAAQTLQQSLEALIGQRLLQVLPGNKEQSELFDRYVQVVETNQPHDIEIPYEADGIHGWFRNMAVKLGDGVAISFRDITARKSTEERLQVRQAELENLNQQLQILFEQAPVGFVLFEPEPPYQVLAHNTVYQRFWSEPFRTSGVVGLPKQDFVPGFETSPTYEIFREVAQTGVAQSFSAYSFSGLERGQTWWNWSLSPIFVDGQLTALVQVVVEVTEEVKALEQLKIELAERQRVEQALRASEVKVQRQLAEIEATYASAPVGLCVFDRDLRYRRINQHLAEINGLTAEQHLGRTVRELIPSIADQVEPVLQQILETGEPFLHVEVSGETPAQPGVQRFWVENWIPLIDSDNQIIGVNVMAQEITEKKRAEQRRQHMEDLSTALVGALSFTQVACVLIEKGMHILGAAAGIVVTLDETGSMLEIVESIGHSPSLVERWRCLPLATPDDPLALSIRTAQPLWLESLDNLLEHVPAPPEGYQDADHQAWVCLPLRAGRKIIGGLGLSFSKPRSFDPMERSFMRSFIDYCAQALERARLYDLEEQTRITAEKNAARIAHLQMMTAALAQALTVEEVARIMVEQGVMALGAANGTFQLLTEHDTAFRLLHNSTPRLSAEELEGWQQYPAHPEYPMTDVVLNKQSLWFVSSEELVECYPSMASVTHMYPGANVLLPVIVREKAVGGVSFAFRTSHIFEPDERDFIIALTQQCAQALERVQLYEDAQKMAATHERERLARDLHDAVSQTLFAASILAEALPRQWRKAPEQVGERLEQLHQLTRGAQSEMRALLLELRPTALLEADMTILLPQLADAIRSRKLITIRVEVMEEEALPPDVKVGFYRIAQEALNNIAKHSHATDAAVQFRCRGGKAELVIADNGDGFDLAQVASTSLGLKIMHERAAAAGVILTISTMPQQGTQITATWSSA